MSIGVSESRWRWSVLPVSQLRSHTPLTMKEVTKPIPNHPDYTISNYGVVTSYKRKKPNVMIPRKHNKGYLKIKLDGVQYFIHRLVLMTFIGDPPPEKPQARHLDGDPTNNRLTNLRWASQAENEDDKRYAGTYHLRGNCYA